MFERYTEKARRVIFFARYEASQYGSPYIETEHLLLGIVREDKALLDLFGRQLHPGEKFRRRIEEAQPIRKFISTSVDLPLSNASKRVLAYAAEESERLGHKHIGSEHLFLGLLREASTVAARVLTELGLTLDQAREKIARRASPDTAASLVFIHGEGWEGGYVKSAVEQYRMFVWERRKWKARDVLREKQSGRLLFYAGQEFDQSKFELQRGGWKQDECVVCRWRLYESDDPERGVGYTNGRDWLCTECYDRFFAPPITPLDDLYT